VMSLSKGQTLKGGYAGVKRRVIVTGGYGFIGSTLVERLAGDGSRVLVLDVLADPPRPMPEHEALAVDISTRKAAHAVAAFKPDLVVHAAAQTSVTESIADSAGDARVNVVGTVRMLEATRAARAGSFIFISSAAIYGDPPRLPVPETEAQQPLSPYGLSKWAATRYVNHFHRSGLLHAITVVPANVYGPGQEPGGDGAVVAAFVKAAACGEAIRIQGDGGQTRDFVYVDDLVEAILLAPGADPGVALINIGTGVETSIAHLANIVEEVSGRSLSRLSAPPRPEDIRRSSLDSTLASRVLGWQPKTDLREGLATTFRWWRERVGAGASRDKGRA